MAQTVKNPPAMQGTWVQSLGWEDPLEKEMATRSSILAWRIPWTEETDRLQFMGLQRVGHDWVTNTFTFTFIILLGASKVVLLVKNPPASAKDASYTGSIPGSGRFPWSRKWVSTSIFLPREFHKLRSLQSMGPQRIGHDWLTLFIFLLCLLSGELLS